jgi:glutamyl-tRNA synthetase
VSRSPAQFDQAKLTWLNHEYIKEADNARLAALVAPLIEQRGGMLAGGPDLAAVVALVKDRAHTLQEIAQGALLFYANAKAEPALLAQHVTDAVKPALSTLREKLARVVWERAAISAAIKETLAQHAIKMPQLAMPVRVLVAGQAQTPSLDAVLELFGRERVIAALGGAA